MCFEISSGQHTYPLKTSLDKETEPQVQQVIKLAIAQLEQQLDTEDDWD